MATDDPMGELVEINRTLRGIRFAVWFALFCWLVAQFDAEAGPAGIISAAFVVAVGRFLWSGIDAAASLTKRF